MRTFVTSRWLWACTSLILSPALAQPGANPASKAKLAPASPVSDAPRPVLPAESPVVPAPAQPGGSIATPSVAKNAPAANVPVAPNTALTSGKGGDVPSPPIFAPTSFWYTPLPKDAPLHPNSANFVTEFLRQKKAYYGTVSINLKSYASPVYRVGPEVKAVPVTQWDCQKKGYLDKSLAVQWQAVPIPPFAEQADGTDAEMTVYQSTSDTIWEFWQARTVDGQWQACWGGRMQHVSQNAGIWPKFYGTTATGLPFLGGQITAEELQRGAINHVMGISLVDAEKWSVFSWPANRSDGYNPQDAPNRIPEGLRFRLDPAVDVEALPLHPLGKIIARAAQKYGLVVWDKAGAITLRAENPKSYTLAGQPDPYPPLFKGTPAYAILNNFPWDKLQFLPLNYGQPAAEQPDKK